MSPHFRLLYIVCSLLHVLPASKLTSSAFHLVYTSYKLLVAIPCSITRTNNIYKIIADKHLNRVRKPKAELLMMKFRIAALQRVTDLYGQPDSKVRTDPDRRGIRNWGQKNSNSASAKTVYYELLFVIIRWKKSVEVRFDKIMETHTPQCSNCHFSWTSRLSKGMP